MKQTLILLFVACFYLSTSSFIHAENLTRVGAEAGGNSTGEIPAFNDKIHPIKCPEGYEKGSYLPNPYKDDKPLFRIDHTNVEKYKERLTPGQVARIKRNPNFYMNIYPTRRNFTFPEEYYRATLKNASTCKLNENNVLTGFNGGIPFIRPKNGNEAIWNIKKPWSGNDLITNDCRRIVSPSGKIKKSIWQTKIMALDKTRLSDPLDNPDGISLKILCSYTYPPDRKGEASLSFAYIDDTKEDDIWSYMPSLRRVRRAPTYSKGMQLDGESTADENGFDYRGPINDWEWKLIGKKEIYTPSNNYDMWKEGADDKDECHPQDINPALLRYELHRVWVVEGTLKEGLNHPYSRRVGYYDEDHWAPSVADRYDRRGNLWRMAEYFQIYNYCENRRYVTGYIYLNLESGRYELYGGSRDKYTRTNICDTGIPPKEFTIEALRKAGR